jgi:uncharacterized membrane protein YkoI
MMREEPRLLTSWTNLAGLIVASLLAVTPMPASSQATHPEVSQRSKKSDLEKGLKVSLRDAIAIAERHSNGGKILEISYQGRRKSEPTYGVRAYQNGEMWEGKIDAASGRLIAWKIVQEDDEDDEDTVELEAAKNATVALGQAVSIAEQHAAGTAITAGIEETKRGVVWEVVVFAGGKARKVLVNPATGNVQ